MSKEKQIEEMADDVRRIRESYFGQADYLFAMKLYEDGYRKKSETVIELPCKVGTTVFTIKNDCIEQERVCGIKIGNCGILLQIANNNDGFDFYYDVEVGRRLFFEKKKAEKALAKMKGGE